MYVFGAFELDIQPGTPDNPASVRVALLRQESGPTPVHHPWGFAPSHRGEGQIMSLHDEVGKSCAGARWDPQEAKQLDPSLWYSLRAHKSHTGTVKVS